jgi:hypothetical protein
LYVCKVGHESTNFYGGLMTYAEGCRLTPTAYMVMTCNDVGIPPEHAARQEIQADTDAFRPLLDEHPRLTRKTLCLG